MNSLVENLKKESNWTYTENGAYALESTNNCLVDLFGSIGGLRSCNETEIIRMFSKAFSEDKLLATKMSFYARDIRNGGLGERRTARIIWKFLANNYPEIMKKNITNIPLFGRFDDLYELVGTPVEDDVWKYIFDIFYNDILNMNTNKPVSLLAKWLKSVNTSSTKSKRLGRLTAKHLNLSYNKYKKYLSELRKYINVVERDMSYCNWKNITYSQVPSRAMNIYRNAFQRNDTDRFNLYIENVKNGQDKINSATLYPYDIVEKYLYTNHNYCADKVLEEQWKNLPNYLNEDNSNILIMADVSGSMSGRPMATSIGLAIYFAERNIGAFSNLFMTFSEHPKMVKLKGCTLREKIDNAKHASWGMNTNIESAFNLVLNTAIKNNISKDEMPKSIIIISDMQMDVCSDVRRWTFYDSMKDKFNKNSYDIPNIVFWNVNSRKDTFHTQSDYKGVQLASGQSASVFKSIIECVDMTPYDAMVKILSNQVYDCIKV